MKPEIDWCPGPLGPRRLRRPQASRKTSPVAPSYFKEKETKKKRNSVNFRNLFGSDPILRNAIMYFILYFINSVIYYLFTFYF